MKKTIGRQHHSRVVRGGRDVAHDEVVSSISGTNTEKVPEAHAQVTVVTNQAKWQPFWLRQKVMASFIGLFFCLTAVCAGISFYSRYHDGLFEASNRQAYVWRFGPAAILTLVSILWSRVQLQLLLYMHWIAMRDGRDLGEEGYRLDYSQLSLPVALVKSWRLKHYAIPFVVAVSFIIKAQIVLSAALFQIKPTRVYRPVNIRTADAFATAPIDDDNITMSAYDTAVAVGAFDMDYPFGVSPDFAYQTIKDRGTAESPIEAVVDGLFMNTTCRKLESWAPQSTETIESNGIPRTFATVILDFEDCDNSIPAVVAYMENAALPGTYGGVEQWWAYNNTLMPQRPCSSLPQQHKQFIYITSKAVPSSQNQSILELESLHGALCTPSSWVSKVRVVDDGVSPKATVVSGADHIEVSSNLWDILPKIIPDGSPPLMSQHGLWSPSAWMSGPVAVSLKFGDEVLPTDPVQHLMFQRTDILEQAVMNLTRELAPMVGHYMIRQDGGEWVEATQSEEIPKLHVNEGVGLAMMLLFVLPGVVSIWCTIRFNKTSCPCNRNPATILGFMVFSEYQLEHVSFVENRPQNKSQWSHGTSAPLILRPWIRGGFTLFTVCFLASLSITLEFSRVNEGLGTISGPGSRFVFLWTSLPTFIMLAVAQYVSVCDSVIRGLAPFSLLLARHCSAAELDISLLDMLGFQALYYSVRLKAPAVSVSQILTACTAFLTALSAVLFSVEIVPETTSTELQQTTWFGSRWFPEDAAGASKYQKNRERMSSLILSSKVSNLTYPANTYNDLVFPALQLDSLDWGRGVSVKALIPAAKLVPTCSRIAESEFEIEVQESSDRPDFSQKVSCPDGSTFTDNPSLLQLINEDTAYFTHTFPSPDNPYTTFLGCDPDPLSGGYDQGSILQTNPSWRLQTFVWGKFSDVPLNFDYFSAWKCNYSWAEVVTETTLVQSENGKPMIDHTRPPLQISEPQPWMPPFAVPDFDNTLANEFISSLFPGTMFPDRNWSDHRLNTLNVVFRTIAEPFGPITIENLGDENYEAQVLEALHHNIALAAGQLASVENRLDIDETSVVEPSRPDALAPISATISEGQRYRLVQNQGITFAIIGILSTVVLVNSWALLSKFLRQHRGRGHWLLDMEYEGVAPDGYNSIEMMEALLHGSNAGAFLPVDAQNMQPDELYRQLRAKKFRMRWFNETERVYTIGLQDEGSGLSEGNDNANIEALNVLHDTRSDSCVTVGPLSTPR